MKVLRTPDACFEPLSSLFPFAPRYTEVPFGDASVRVHFLDEGPRDAPVVLMLHGEPSWSFLYRKVIARVVGAGLRAIAPDLVGFGRSDKPAAREDYTYQRHVDSMAAFLAAIDLQGATLLCQDWGGLIGLRLVAEHGERFARVVAANTFLPTGDRKTPDAFFAWQQFSQSVPELPVGKIVQTGCAVPLPAEVVSAYDAPFPDETFKAGARQFPMLVPTSPNDPASGPNRRAWESLQRWTKPFHTAFGDSDPITRGADRVLQEKIPGAKDAEHVTIAGAAHFLQEDKGDELGDAVVRFVGAR
jgi:haloalkane dehalogenase